MFMMNNWWFYFKTLKIRIIECYLDHIIKMSEHHTDLVTAIAVSSEEMTFSNKVYLSF